MTKLYRSEINKKIAGICGGISDAYALDANLVRVMFVFIGIATGGFPLLIAYIVGSFIIPKGSQARQGEHNQ
jgi:phage shock protein C